MRDTFTVRLPEDLAAWLTKTARASGVSQGSIIREHLEKARSMAERPFMRLAGIVDGPADLSTRKGFTKR